MSEFGRKFEKDQHRELVDSFLHDMGIVSRTLGVMSGSVSEHGAISRNYDQVKSLQAELPELTNHAIKGATVSIAPIMRRWGNDGAITNWFPWMGGREFMGDDQIEGVIADIYPGIGIFIERGPDPKDARFVQVISRIDGKPTSEITILGLPEPQETAA